MEDRLGNAAARSATPAVDIGARVRAMRDRMDASQIDIAAAMTERGHAWHQTTVAKIEKGERNLRASELVALADVLRSTVDAVLGAPKTYETKAMASLRLQWEDEYFTTNWIQSELASVGAALDELAHRRTELTRHLRKSEHKIKDLRRRYADLARRPTRSTEE